MQREANVLERSLKSLQVALGVGALALGATTAVSFASAPARVAEPELVAVEPEAPSVEASFSRYGVIAERDVFRSRLRAPEPPPAPALEESPLNVQLLGTLVAEKRPPHAQKQKPRKRARAARRPRAPIAYPGSHAILRDLDGSVHTLKVGEVFAEKPATLVDIARHRIVVERDGKLETVTLYDETTGTRLASPPAHGAQPRRLGVAGTPRSALSMLEGLLPGGSIEVVADVGVEAYRVPRTSGSGLPSFQEDDRIRAINGMPLSDPELDERVATALHDGAELRLTVEDATGRLRAVPVSPQALEQARNAAD